MGCIPFPCMTTVREGRYSSLASCREPDRLNDSRPREMLGLESQPARSAERRSAGSDPITYRWLVPDGPPAVQTRRQAGCQLPKRFSRGAPSRWFRARDQTRCALQRVEGEWRHIRPGPMSTPRKRPAGRLLYRHALRAGSCRHERESYRHAESVVASPATGHARGDPLSEAAARPHCMLSRPPTAIMIG